MSGAVVNFVWNDSGLRAAAKTAFRTSVVDAKAMARSLAAWRHVGNSVTYRFSGESAALLRAGARDAHWLELGVHPHEIAPGAGTQRTTRSRRRVGGRFTTVTRTTARRGGKQALKFTHGDGGFARGPVGHPGFRGRPFMAPTARAWPGMYVSAARRAFPKVL